jgi:hypothetical protein
MSRVVCRDGSIYIASSPVCSNCDTVQQKDVAPTLYPIFTGDNTMPLVVVSVMSVTASPFPLEYVSPLPFDVLSNQILFFPLPVLCPFPISALVSTVLRV